MHMHEKEKEYKRKREAPPSGRPQHRQAETLCMLLFFFRGQRQLKPRVSTLTDRFQPEVGPPLNSSDASNFAGREMSQTLIGPAE